jgi:hypothetical protein
VKRHDKVATVIFWVIASMLAIVAAGNAFLVGFTRDRPWLFVGGVLVCFIAVLASVNALSS